MLCVLCPEAMIEAAAALIFAETTSIGIRYFPVRRTICSREIRTVCIDGETIHCKISSYNGTITNISAEYDDCRAAAARTGTALKEWQRKAKEEAYNIYGCKATTDC